MSWSGREGGGWRGGRERGPAGRRARGPGGQVAAERGGHAQAWPSRGGEYGGRGGKQGGTGGEGRGRGRGADAARGVRGGGGGPVQTSQPAAGGRGAVGFVREQGSQYGGAGLSLIVRQAAAEVLPAEVERKIVLRKADESHSSSRSMVAVEEQIKDKEFQAAVVALARLPPVSSKAVSFPVRPEFGKIGYRCGVLANHILVEFPDQDIYHYDVTISPETRSRYQNRSIVNELVRLQGQNLDGRLPVYDGRNNIYTAGALPFMNKGFIVKLANAAKGEHVYKVTIKHASNLNLHNLRQFLDGTNRELPQDTIQALDIALRECPTKKYLSVSGSFFPPSFGHDSIGNGVESCRGYYQSLRPTQMGLSLNIDISAASFYKDQLVIDFAVEYLNMTDTSSLSAEDRRKLMKALRGVRVKATHRTDKHIRYKIIGITSVPLKDVRFDQDGMQVFVVNYFKKKYNYSLKHTSWPCIKAGSDSRPIYLPVEVCRIVEGQRYSRRLNKCQVTRILQMTCQPPAQRKEIVLDIVNSDDYGKDSYLKEFGMKMMNQLALVDARVLPAPRVLGWKTNKNVFNGGSINCWACLSLASVEHIDIFYDDLARTCNSIGMQMNLKPCVNITTPSGNDITQAFVESAIRQVLAQRGLSGKQLQLLIIILPYKEYSIGSYGWIKRLCETEIGVITQYCLPEKAKRAAWRNNQEWTHYLENLSLKINVKVGGRNTVLANALQKSIPLLTDEPTIVFGADVTHPSPGEDLYPSIAAVVASMDWPEVTKYKCLMSSQGPREEIIAGLYTIAKDPQKGLVAGGMIRELLISFRNATGHKPKRIIFYRDGVSDGQFSQVLLYEVDAIRKACATLEEGYRPRITFLVVQKRHHTRLFPVNGSGNVLPGTVVDTKICHPSGFDFYLCSHACTKGTSRPTHYHVLLDENIFTADALQTLTYNLCYTYARCTRPVSIVPPVYYAHLAAFRARHYLEDKPSGQDAPVRTLPKIKHNINELMFYV